MKIGYLSQHIFSQTEDETIIEVFRSVINVTEGEARHILAKFLFYGNSVFKKVSELSGGERMRLRLAQLMYEDINLLILDEPTNHLDIESREVLEETLENFRGTILAVSHDRYFLNKLFERIFWLKDQKVYAFEGNYDWAKTKITEIKQDELTEVSKKQNTQAKTIQKSKLGKENTPEELELNIEEIEAKISELDTKLDVEKDLYRLQDFFNEKKLLEVKREQLYTLLDKIE